MGPPPDSQKLFMLNDVILASSVMPLTLFIQKEHAAQRKDLSKRESSGGHLSNYFDLIAPYLTQRDIVAARQTSVNWYTKSLESSVTRFFPLPIKSASFPSECLAHYEGVS